MFIIYTCVCEYIHTYTLTFTCIHIFTPALVVSCCCLFNWHHVCMYLHLGVCMGVYLHCMYKQCSQRFISTFFVCLFVCTFVCLSVDTPVLVAFFRHSVSVCMYYVYLSVCMHVDTPVLVAFFRLLLSFQFQPSFCMYVCVCIRMHILMYAYASGPQYQ